MSWGLLVLFGAGCWGQKARNPHAPADLQSYGAPRRAKIGNKLRVRVWADEPYRREALGWRSDLDRMIAGANAVLEERFGVALEVVEAKPWPRDASDDDLVQVLKELEAHDDGQGADVVIGLVSALPVFPSSLHALGMANLFGHHLVLRGMHDVGDREMMKGPKRKHGLVDDAIRGDDAFAGEDVYLARVRHREVVVLLHELGHVLGLIHLQEPADFMNPYWDPAQHELAPANARLFELSLTELLRIRRGKEPSFAELIAHVERTPDARWDEHERERLLAWLRKVEEVGLNRGGRGTSTATVAYTATSPAAGQEEYALCKKLIDASPRAEGARAPCTRTMELRPDDPVAALNLANAEARAGDPARFEAAITEARARLERHGSPEAWLYYAKVCAAELRVSDAEDGAAKAGEPGDEVRQWAAGMRAKTGLHREEARSGVPRAKESDYLRRVQALEHQLAGRDPRGAAAAIQAALAVYPRSATLWTAECGVRLGMKEPSKAETACARALELDPDLWRAWLTASFVAAARDRVADAIHRAERAVALDPTIRSSWSALANWYKRAGNTAALARLSADYRTRFGEALGTGK